MDGFFPMDTTTFHENHNSREIALATADERRAVCDHCFELAWLSSSVTKHTALVPRTARPLPSTGVDLEAQHFHCKDCGSDWRWTMADGWEACDRSY